MDIVFDRVEPLKILKEDRATTVWQQRFGEQDLIVKRYNTRGRWHAIRRAFRRSRAENCWIMSRVFNQSSIHTPERIAVIQEWLGPFKLRSWFINQYIDAIDLDTFLYARTSEHKPDNARIQSVYNDVQQLFSHLEQHQLAHGDLKATNILLFDQTLYLIDLDAAQQYRFKPGLTRARRKDWQRFMKNWRLQPKVAQQFQSIKMHLPAE